MAFDGITIAAVRKELSDALTGGRVYKIAQPEPDELLLTIKNNSSQYRLTLSASASLPLVFLTGKNKTSPMTAPNFCMLLRKHIQNGRILSITQPGMERILNFQIEHLDEMGDLRTKQLIVELMGKHSNIIFCDENNVIIDSIKHISGMVSSVREVLPGKDYFIPHTQDKENPLETDRTRFMERVFSGAQPCFKALYTSFTGLSPAIAHEICYRAGGNADLSTAALDEDGRQALWEAFSHMMEEVRTEHFSPCIVYEGSSRGADAQEAPSSGRSLSVPAEYAALTLTSYPLALRKDYTSISALLEDYYAEKNTVTRIRQRSSDLRRIVSTALERNIKNTTCRSGRCGTRKNGTNTGCMESF